MKQILLFEDFTKLYGRWKGGEDRKEDKFNPKAIDFGDKTSVYWASDNLELNGNDEFIWDEIKDFYKDGWRLPTRKEVKQLNWKEASTVYNKGYRYLSFPNGKINVNIEKVNEISFWTSDEKMGSPLCYKLNFNNKFSFVVSNKTMKHFVLLVKDKVEK